MYLIQFSLLIGQLLPPPWRDAWPYELIHTLLSPLRATLEGFNTERHTRQAAFGQLQVYALESRLSSLLGERVKIEHRSLAFVFYVRIPPLDPNASAAERNNRQTRRKQIEGWLSRHRLSGTDFEIVTD